MFTKNDEMKRWVNGTLGRIAGLSDDIILVELVSDNAGAVVDVQRVEWESYRYEYNKYLTRSCRSWLGNMSRFL